MKYFVLLLILSLQGIQADTYDKLFSGKNLNPASEPAIVKLYNIFKNEKNLSAEFTQKAFVKVLNKELVSKGRLVFIQGKGVVWQTESPFEQCLYITKNGVVYKKDKPDPIGEFRYTELMTEMVDSDHGNLTTAFEVYFLEEGSDWFLGLKPTKRVISRFLKRIIVSGDSSGKINEVNVMGDSVKITEISFKNHQKLSIKELNLINEFFNKKQY